MEYRGKVLKINIEGESHSDRIDFSFSGIKKDEKISLADLYKFLQRRSPAGKSYATSRKEKDRPIFLEGFSNLDGHKSDQVKLAQSQLSEKESQIYGLDEKMDNKKKNDEKILISDGKPIKGYFLNSDTRSKDYKIFEKIPRPGHIDFVAKKKYGRDYDLSGSSNFSGRMTVALVACGGLAKQVLEKRGIEIGSHISSIYNIHDQTLNPVKIRGNIIRDLDCDLPFIDPTMKEKTLGLVEKFKADKDSFGGIIELFLVGDLNYLGGPYFERLQAKISRLLLSIPGTKGVEFGNGFEASSLKGSQNNDSLIVNEGRVETSTNNAGGIVGGIANGMPIIIRVGVKPTASIGKAQESINLENFSREVLELTGRHDPAFVLRMGPVLEAMLAIAILDEIYYQEAKTLREKIDVIDDQLLDLYMKRIELTDKVAYGKMKKNLPINVPEREKEILDRLTSQALDYDREITSLYESIFKASKDRQENIIRKSKASYGLIGRRLSYSYSKEIHQAFADYDYELIELRPDELDSFLNRRGIRGLNVTIPYKKDVIPYLDGLTREAKQLGVVNTISFRNGKKIGHNTDYYGFKKLLINKRIYVKDKNVLVLGTGATSKTVEAAVKSLGARKVNFVSRTGPLDYSNLYNLRDLNSYEVLINTTPVGTNSIDDKILVDLEKLPQIKAVVDVIYNPLYSQLIIEAKKRSIKATGGLDMLVYQAKKAVEIFTGKKILADEARKIRDDIFLSKCNIVLVGMPGSGKTTIGRQVAKKIGKVHVDLDDEFYKEFKIRPDRVIAEMGEAKFRDMESKIARKFGKMNNLVISTGGGVVTREENYKYLKQNALIILIDRDVRRLSTRGRILSQGGINSLYSMKSKRQPSYRMFADYTVVNDGYFRYAVDKIVDLIDKKIGLL